MNKTIKKLWLKALKSGKYTHGKEALKIGTGENTKFCCLGVLCDLHRKLKRKEGWKENASANEVFSSYLDEFTSLPPQVQFWSGLFKFNQLAYINDARSTNDYLKQIKYIKEKL